ncbi:MAG: prepilin-type N-terminal cleavage/methylation domain-containing protein [Bacilli bacterium]|nr:prepilin-type N-terminal cleavage/methylation domain-containing protein [Bacilli bacterium]
MKAFTLIELLAVIIILGIILTISIPSISETIESSTKQAFKIDTQSVLHAISAKRLINISSDPTAVFLWIHRNIAI